MNIVMHPSTVLLRTCKEVRPRAASNENYSVELRMGGVVLLKEGVENLQLGEDLHLARVCAVRLVHQHRFPCT